MVQKVSCALYVRRSPRVRLKAQIHGGGHERGMRSGTLATHQIQLVWVKLLNLQAKQCMQNKNVFVNFVIKLWNGLQDLEQVFLKWPRNSKRC